MPAPGFPAYVHVHTNGRVYAGTYVHSGSTMPSKVVEWSPDGTLLRSWSVPGQVLGEDHGVQVANQTHNGKLVLLETSTASILTLDVRTGQFRRLVRPDPRCRLRSDNAAGREIKLQRGGHSRPVVPVRS